MTLDRLSHYSIARSYVLKLHRNARPEHDKIIGRLEHMASGRHHDFRSWEELLASLALELSQLTGADGGNDPAEQPAPKPE
jgi:hypothetical protein